MDILNINMLGFIIGTQIKAPAGQKIYFPALYRDKNNMLSWAGVASKAYSMPHGDVSKNKFLGDKTWSQLFV